MNKFSYYANASLITLNYMVDLRYIIIALRKYSRKLYSNQLSKRIRSEDTDKYHFFLDTPPFILYA